MLNITQTVTIEEGILICTVLRFQPRRVVNNNFFFLDKKKAGNFPLKKPCEPVCCRPPNAFGGDATTPAGKWGDYNCGKW